MTDFEILDVWMRKNEDKIFHSDIGLDQLNKGVKLLNLKEFERAFKKSQSKILFGMTVVLETDSYKMEQFNRRVAIQEIKDELNKRIDDYNDSISKIDFSDPWILYVYFIYEGVPVSYVAFNEKYEDIEDTDEAWSRIESEVFEIYDDKKIQDIHLDLSKKADEDLRLITEVILEDKGFHSCTNHELRVQYMKKLLIKYPEYKKKINAAGYYKTSTYADHVWKMYKESKKI